MTTTRIHDLVAVGLVFTVGLATPSAAASMPARAETSSAAPPVKRVAQQLARSGAKSVIVFVSTGGKEYVATAGERGPTADQRFRVGSVTKTFTATIVLQLVDERKLRLHSTLEDFLPGVVPRGNEITIRQLLQHRSGLVNYTDYLSWLKGASRSSSTRPIDLLRFAGSKPLAFAPGSQWSYSNTNYIALGLVIEKITGHSYAQELEQRILDPLGLDDTELPQTRLLPDLQDDGKLHPAPGHPKGDPSLEVDWANPILSWAAGAIVSNARDLSRFYSALLSARILSSASLARMKETVLVDGPEPLRAGLGIFSRNVRCGRAWGHGGGILDYTTLVSASEEGDRVGVISVRGSFEAPDESALVCPESRLAESAEDSKIAFIRTLRSGDGRRRKSELYVANADGSGQRRLTRNAARDNAPAWSPGGRKIAFVSRRDGNSEIYVMNADGSGRRNLTRNAAPDLLPAWSPDGRKIAFVRERGGGTGDVYVMSADGSGQRRLTRNAARDAAPAWSPAGRKIAFVSRRDGNSEIYVMNADGSGRRNLTRNAFRDAAPAWSPDGRRIAFASRSHGNFELYVMNADGSGLRSLKTRDPAGDLAPVWSPDGRRIAFERRLTFGGGVGAGVKVFFDVYVVNADGSGQLRPLTKGGRQPLWSPDGRMIAFLNWRVGDAGDVCVMNADGSGQRNLTRRPADEFSFAWSPVRKK
jgi:Tol biopolymer transport system component/CubicO group peptidase (beta-lactamase class C family)